MNPAAGARTAGTQTAGVRTAGARRPRAPATGLLSALTVLASLAFPDTLAAQEGLPPPKPSAPGPPRAGPDPPPPGGVELVEKARGLTRPGEVAPRGARAPQDGDRVSLALPRTTVSIDFVRVGGLWWSTTEVTWDAYDVLVFGLDRTDAPAPAGPDAGAPNGANGGANEEVRGPDAVLRPTKPHMVTDRGWGHAGYPALSMSAHAAAAFCEWLSATTGARARLPTEAEWEAVALAGAPRAADGTAPPWACGEDPACLDTTAWTRTNSERKTHPVGRLAPSAAGLFDLHGNVAEWVDGRDGSPVLKGGCYRDASKDCRIDARKPPVAAWNQSDPNLPKSVWWLADAPFAGFRIVCEDVPTPSGDPR